MGLYDDSVLLDSVDRSFLGQVALQMKYRCPRGEKLCKEDLSTWSSQLEACAAHLGLGLIHPYVLRHSGPPDDHLRQRRSLREIQHRERWSQDGSAKRYTKAARTMTQMSTWTPDMKFHFKRCESAIGAVLLGKKLPLTFRGKVSQRPLKAFHPNK